MSTKREWFAAFRLAMLLASSFADLSAGDANQMLAAGILFEAMAVALAFVAVRIRRQRDR